MRDDATRTWQLTLSRKISVYLTSGLTSFSNGMNYQRLASSAVYIMDILKYVKALLYWCLRTHYHHYGDLESPGIKYLPLQALRVRIWRTCFWNYFILAVSVPLLAAHLIIFMVKSLVCAHNRAPYTLSVLSEAGLLSRNPIFNLSRFHTWQWSITLHNGARQPSEKNLKKKNV